LPISSATSKTTEIIRFQQLANARTYTEQLALKTGCWKSQLFFPPFPLSRWLVLSRRDYPQFSDRPSGNTNPYYFFFQAEKHLTLPRKCKRSQITRWLFQKFSEPACACRKSFLNPEIACGRPFKTKQLVERRCSRNQLMADKHFLLSVKSSLSGLDCRLVMAFKQ
jgi:hypothetical protein